MALNLQWVASCSASVLHAAAALIAGTPPAAPELWQPLVEPVAALSELLQRLGIQPDALFAHLIPLSVGIPENRMLAEVALRKTVGPQSSVVDVEALARVLSGLRAAQLASQPSLLDELSLRSGPLREQWETYGPGLVRLATRMTEPELWVEEATVWPVYPFAGGGGVAHPPYNGARIEAVLANPRPELPEVVRLVWLVSQANLDLPRYADRLARPALVGALANIPAVVAAAAELELVSPERLPLKNVLTWWVGIPPEQATPLAATLAAWWEAVLGERPRWSIALAGLEAMIGAEPSNPLPADIEPRA